MQYHHVSYEQLETFCREVFKGYHFTEEESRQITDVLLAADLSAKSKDSVLRICYQADCPTAQLPFNMDEIWFLVGKRSGILAVTDAAFAKKLSELLESVDETNRRDTI